MWLDVARCGAVEYGCALAWQEALLARRLDGGRDALLLLEHPAVYTLGRGAEERFLRAAAEGAAPVWRVARGGEVTYHGPGQLVGYPIVHLAAFRQDLHWYLRLLEQVLIDTLSTFGASGERVAGRTGVWVGGRKIASIGIAVRRWVTWHGFALNVAADTSGFQSITPCGLDGIEMTSMAAEGVGAAVDDVAAVVRDRFVAALGYEGWEPLEPAAPEHLQ